MSDDFHEKNNVLHEDGSRGTSQFVTLYVNDQLFGIPILQVQDVLGPQRLTPIPLAPKQVAGALNLRGRIVTAIDVRKRLGLPPREGNEKGMSVAVEIGTELYSLVVDSVGEVMKLPTEDYEAAPPTLDPVWRDISDGIFRLKGDLLVVLDVERLLNTQQKAA
ncbi:MAG: chemotaxis protein CheW [Alphaproteobacteria bacterium]